MALRALCLACCMGAASQAAMSQESAATRVQNVLQDSLDHARLTLICAEADQARSAEILQIWAKSVRDTLMALDAAEVSPRNISALAASRDGKTLRLRDGELAAEWQARCSADTSWQGDEALDRLRNLPSLVEQAL